MKTNSTFWVHLYWLLLSLLLLFSSNSFGQVISIDEFLQTNLASKQITETFSYECPDRYYTSTYSDKYLSITLSQPRTVNTDEGSRKVYDPYRLEIFNSQGELLNIQPKCERFRVAGFLEGEKDCYVLQQWAPDNYEVGIYDLGGNLVKPLHCRDYIYCSPTGKFYYHQSEEAALTIYDENGNRSLRMTDGVHGYRANAASDSTLLVAYKDTLSFWNIMTQETIWKSKIPPEQELTFDGSSGIQYSISGNLIVLYSGSGCYCFNFQGDFLWADKDYGFRVKQVEYTGVSRSSGDVAIVYFKYGTQHSLFAKIFDRQGTFLGENEIQLGENVKYAGNTNFAAVVFNDYILFRIFSRTDDQDIEPATCLLYKENQSWSFAVVSGFWYFLNEGSQMERLIGYDPRSQQIRGFQLK